MLYMALTGIAATTAPSVYAQEEDSVLEEIVVTAQKRAENLQTVPIAVTTANEQFIISNDVRTLEDLNGAIPGFVTTNTVAYSAAPLTIRGIGGANGGGNFFNDEPVGVYVDGLYVGRLSFSTADLQDIESIQVLRGPQGTLYGRNSTAGAVLVTTNRPTDEFEGVLQTRIAEFDEYRVSGAISGRLSDSVNARASLAYADKAGFGENTVDGSSVGGSEDLTARVSFSYQASDTLSLDLIGEYMDREARPALIAVTGVGATGVASPFVARSDLDSVLDSNRFALNDDNRADSSGHSLTLLAEWDLGWATLNSISGYRSWELDGSQDSDSTALQLFNNNGSLDANQFTEELRLTSNNDSALSWIVGAYYLQESTSMLFDIRNFQALFGLGTEAIFDADQDTDAFALFADATYELNDQLSLTVGGRYSHETKDFNNDFMVLILNGGTVPMIPPAGPLGGLTFPAGATFRNPPQFTDSETFDDFSPRVVLDYQATDDLFLYASYSQGFKSGGFNSFGLTPAFESESIDAFEVGFKSDLADGRVRLNGSFFWYDYADLQIRLPVPTGGVNIQNIGEADISGIELEATALLTKGFTVTANISYLDTEITQGQIPAVSSATPPFPIGIPLTLTPEDVSGNSLTRAPEWQAYLNAAYDIMIGELNWRFSATYKYQSDVFFLETNQDINTFSNDSWNELDVRVSLSDPDDRWEVALFGQNITDDRHITAVTALGGFPNAAVNEPAKYGLDMNFRY